MQKKKHAALVYFAARVEKKLRIKRVPHWGFRPILAILGINFPWLNGEVEKPISKTEDRLLILVFVFRGFRVFDLPSGNNNFL